MDFKQSIIISCILVLGVIGAFVGYSMYQENIQMHKNYIAAQDAFRNANLQEAEKLLEGKPPRDIAKDFYILKYNVQMNTNELYQAEQTCMKLLKLNPQDAFSNYLLSLVYYNLGDRDNTELRYSIRPQFELTMAYGVRHITIPDFQIMCTYAKIGGIEIEDFMKIPWWSVYLDGYKYHACDPNMRFYSDLEKREGIKQAKPQRMFSWTITWEDIQLFESEKEDELGLNSVSRLGQLLEKAQLGTIKEDCFWCINDVPNFFPNRAAFYDGSIQLDNNCDENLTDTSSDDEVDQAFSNAVKYEIHLHKGLRELDKDEWVSFWRRYNLIQFWSAGSNEEADGVVTEAVVNREEIKEFYPGMEDIVDILLDNNVPFSHEGIFELTNADNEVIASAAMIIDNPKIAIDPFDTNDSSVFEQNGYMVIAQEDFNEELIK